MGKQLSEKDLDVLRKNGHLKSSETAFKEGEILIAEDLVSKERRIISASGLMLEANQKILLD